MDVLLRKMKKNFFFQEQKIFFQGTTFVQFFMYCKAKKKNSNPKFFVFENLLHKKMSERWDFNLC